MKRMNTTSQMDRMLNRVFVRILRVKDLLGKVASIIWMNLSPSMIPILMQKKSTCQMIEKLRLEVEVLNLS
jgi:hypothetical protein